LYYKDWRNAEITASGIISNATLFSLQSNLKTVFTKNNPEAILQFRCSSINLPWDYVTFYVRSTPPSLGALRSELVSEFSDGDKRRVDWIQSIVSPAGETFHFPTKYSSSTQLAEYSTLLRLSEQYLIRAEARAQQDNLSGAQADLNTIRARAQVNLSNTLDKQLLLQEIAREKRLELFTEWGHRWLDLKRTGQIDNALIGIKPEWKSQSALLPIPEEQILNSGIDQNPGY
jgi:starch-binding outer membrane protein, SusD/RagB family